MVRAWPRAWLLSANQEVSPHVSHGLPEMLMPLIPEGNKALVREVWKTLYPLRVQYTFLIALLYGLYAKHCHQ